MMNANKTALCCFLSFAAFGFVPLASAHAEASAPALFGVKEIQIEHARMGNAAASAACGTSGGEIAKMVEDSLKMDNLPVFSMVNAPNEKPDSVRITLLPEVTTLQPTDKSCVSWLSLSAQSRNTLLISPLPTPRHAMVTYWSGGVMISSNVSSHSRTINEAVDKLCAQFSRQYRLDQPPVLPAGK